MQQSIFFIISYFLLSLFDFIFPFSLFFFSYFFVVVFVFESSQTRLSVHGVGTGSMMERPVTGHYRGLFMDTKSAQNNLVQRRENAENQRTILINKLTELEEEIAQNSASILVMNKEKAKLGMRVEELESKAKDFESELHKSAPEDLVELRHALEGLKSRLQRVS